MTSHIKKREIRRPMYKIRQNLNNGRMPHVATLQKKGEMLSKANCSNNPKLPKFEKRHVDIIPLVEEASKENVNWYSQNSTSDSSSPSSSLSSNSSSSSSSISSNSSLSPEFQESSTHQKQERLQRQKLLHLKISTRLPDSPKLHTPYPNISSVGVIDFQRPLSPTKPMAIPHACKGGVCATQFYHKDALWCKRCLFKTFGLCSRCKAEPRFSMHNCCIDCRKRQPACKSVDCWLKAEFGSRMCLVHVI